MRKLYKKGGESAKKLVKKIKKTTPDEKEIFDSAIGQISQKTLKNPKGTTKRKMKKMIKKKGGAKPDYLDMDGDGNKTESMKFAISSKKKMKKGGKKKMYGGMMKKKKKKMMGGTDKKMMYKKGGFKEPSFIEPPIKDIFES